MTSMIVMLVAGGVVGLITPSAIGPQWWKFCLGMLALFAAHIAGLIR